MIKVQYDVQSPKEYLASLSPDWRKEKLKALRALILKQSGDIGDIEETINYKMLCYRIGDNVVFHLNAQKTYVSLYVGDIEKIDPTGRLLHGLNVGKGCIRFTKSKAVDTPNIEMFIAQSIALCRAGVDLGC